MMPAAVMLLTVGLCSASKPLEIIAHRGASQDAPENTRAALRLAFQQGADASECDVHLTSDGRLVVIHDADTERTAGIKHIVARTAFDELRQLDVGRWKDPRFAGERIPTLAELLADMPAGKRLFIEVKCGPEALPELFRTLDASKLPTQDLPIITFHTPVLQALKRQRPRHPAYWVVNLEPKNGPRPQVADLIRQALASKADGLDLSASAHLTPQDAQAITQAGLKFYVWTVNDLPTAQRMVELGVDGITTDRPGWLREQLQGRR